MAGEREAKKSTTVKDYRITNADLAGVRKFAADAARKVHIRPGMDMEKDPALKRFFEAGETAYRLEVAAFAQRTGLSANDVSTAMHTVPRESTPAQRKLCERFAEWSRKSEKAARA
jgi:hypothetical protein